jgi:hypothetical protein
MLKQEAMTGSSALVKGGREAMMGMKIKIAAAVVGVSLVGAGGGLAAYPSQASAEKKVNPPAVAKAKSKQEWASPLDKVKPGEWYEAPDSKFSAGVFSHYDPVTGHIS